MRGGADEQVERRPEANGGPFRSHPDEIAYLMSAESALRCQEEALVLAVAAIRRLLAELKAGGLVDSAVVEPHLLRIELLLDQVG